MAGSPGGPRAFSLTRNLRGDGTLSGVSTCWAPQDALSETSAPAAGPSELQVGPRCLMRPQGLRRCPHCLFPQAELGWGRSEVGGGQGVQRCGAVGAWVRAHLGWCVCGRQITAFGGCPFGDGVGTFPGASSLAAGGPSGIWSPGTQQRAGPLTRTHHALRLRPQPPASLSLQGSVPRQAEAPGQPRARWIKAEGHGEGETGPAQGGGGWGRGSSARASAGGAGSEQVCPAAARRWQRAGARTPRTPSRAEGGEGGVLSRPLPFPASPSPRHAPPCRRAIANWAEKGPDCLRAGSAGVGGWKRREGGRPRLAAAAGAARG